MRERRTRSGIAVGDEGRFLRRLRLNEQIPEITRTAGCLGKYAATCGMIRDQYLTVFFSYSLMK